MRDKYPPPINSEFRYNDMTFVAKLNTVPYGNGACRGCYFDNVEDCRDPRNRNLPRCCSRTFHRIDDLDDLPKIKFEY